MPPTGNKTDGGSTVDPDAGTDVNGSTVNIQGGPMVFLNPSGALFAGRVTDTAPDQIIRGAATVLEGGPQFPYDVRKLRDGRIQVGDHIFIEADPRRPNFQAEALAAMGVMSALALRYQQASTSGLIGNEIANQSGLLEVRVALGEVHSYLYRQITLAKVSDDAALKALREEIQQKINAVSKRTTQLDQAVIQTSDDAADPLESKFKRYGNAADVALDISIRALVTLGTVDEASSLAQMTVEAVELEPE